MFKPDFSFIHIPCLFSQGDVERGRQLIQEGIALRKELGVPFYVAAGYCDLGRKLRMQALFLLM